MGCYDTLIIKCPDCNEPYYAQSKSGECLLNEYPLELAPSDVLFDVNRHAPFKCTCGTEFSVSFVIERKMVLVERDVVTHLEVVKHQPEDGQEP